MRQPAGPGAAQPGAGSLRGHGSLGRPISGPPLAVVASCHLPLPSSQPVRRVCPSGARRGGGGQLHIQSLPSRLGAPVQSFMLQQFPEPGRAAGLCARETRGPGMVLHLAASPPTFPRPWVWLQAGSRLGLLGMSNKKPWTSSFKTFHTDLPLMQTPCAPCSC